MAKDEKRGTVAQLLDFAGERRGLTIVGCALSAVAMAINMVPYVCVWLLVRDLVSVAPNWAQATGIAAFGWAAFGFAVAGIVVYFCALMCTHLAAFRTATNIRKRCMEYLSHAPLGYFDTHASGLLRRRIDGAAAQTETLLAHNLADITGTAAMFVTLLVLLFVFDWRMGAACMLAAVVSIGALFAMMGGKNAGLMAEYYDALDRASKAGTEYVRGIPVVKVFQQTVYSFRAFKEAIDAYSEKASHYQGVVCKGPQALNLTVTEGAFVFLVPVALLIAPGALASGNFAIFVTNFAFYAVFSAVLSTALAKIMFASGGLTQAGDALRRINEVLDAPTLPVAAEPKVPTDNSVVFDGVTFAYEGAEKPALDNVSFVVESGKTVALVGPSGGGKTTAASLIPRFWDVDTGTVRVGGVDVRDMDPHVLMDRVAFVFQNTRLFSTSILENVRAAAPHATRQEALEALHAAQCDDILAKLPEGADTIIGSEGTYLSGGEQQRIALARAILKDAPIVVLDEATAFADPENEALIQKAFARLLAGRTVVMIAHRLSTVVGADKIVVLESGRVAEQGAHDELVSADGLYARMWADYQTAAQWKIQKKEEVEGPSTSRRENAPRAEARDASDMRRATTSGVRVDASGERPRQHNKAPRIFGEAFRKKYALSEAGEANVKRGTLWTVVTNLLVIGGIGFLFMLMQGYMATLTQGAPLPKALPFVAGTIAFVALSFFTHLQQYHYTYSVVYDEVGLVRTNLAERLRKLPLTFFAHRDLAELTETMMSDVDRLEHVWSHVLGYLYGGYISTAIIAVMALAYDWRLALACLWGVPVAFALLFGTRRVFDAYGRRAKAAGLAVADSIQEALEDMREIRATNQEGRYLDGVNGKIDEFEHRMTAAELRTGVFVNAASVIMRLGMATTVLVGARLILSGGIDFMALFMFLLMVTRVYAPFDQSLALIAEVFVSDVSVQRLNEIFDSPVADGTEEFAPQGFDVTFDHVGFSYDETGDSTLEDVSFVAREGEVTALVGPSGSGKSTCARLAARLWDHDTGSLTVGGVEVLGVDPETLMGSFSMVFQDVTLFDDTVMENIRLGRRGATDEEVLAAATAANCDEFVVRLANGYATPIGENGARLSGGERQRISIARALLKDAPIVLLDEATASLDVENETKVQAALSRLLKNKTVIVIAHRMRTVMGANKVVVLEDGRVLEQGTPQALLAANGAFARMVRLQSESASWSM